MNREEKNNLIATYKINDQDTGSVDVQIALLTKRINELNDHLKLHKHDYSTKAGLIKLVGQRRSFMKYLNRVDAVRYKKLIDQLGLRS